jgi:hypothetical protein
MLQYHSRCCGNALKGEKRSLQKGKESIHPIYQFNIVAFLQQNTS